MKVKREKRTRCPDCGKGFTDVKSEVVNPIEHNPMILMQKAPRYSRPEDLYRRVLEIGSECITCGISFNELRHRLIEHENFEFDENGCLDRCLREWFWNSFFPRRSTLYIR